MKRGDDAGNNTPSLQRSPGSASHFVVRGKHAGGPDCQAVASLSPRGKARGGEEGPRSLRLRLGGCFRPGRLAAECVPSTRLTSTGSF